MVSKEDKLLEKLGKLETKREDKEKLAELKTKIANEKEKIRDLTPHRKFDKEKWDQIKTNVGNVLKGFEKVGTAMQPNVERMNKKIEETL